MNIVACIKQVPDTNEVRIDSKTNNLVREGVPSIMNPFDESRSGAGSSPERTLWRKDHGSFHGAGTGAGGIAAGAGYGGG